MAYFEERDHPEIHGATFYISDDSGNRAALKARQAYELLQWLYERRAKLWQLVHPGLNERSLPTWLRNLPEWATEEEQSTDSDANAGENGV